MTLWPTAIMDAMRPEEPLTVSEWGERYRTLPRRGTAEPGRLDLSRTPYMREPLDCLGDDQHTEVVLVKAAQVGGSEGAKTAIGYWVDTSADSILLVLPDQKTAEEHCQERIHPMLREPRLRRWITPRTYDLRKSQVDLVHATIYLGWSGSPQSLASRAIRCAVFDETDKSRDHAKEAATVDLVRDRLLTYGHRAKLLLLSTPTTKGGPIWQAWLGTADRRTYHIPCPHCGTLQEQKWEQVRWDDRDEKDPDALLGIADALLAGTREAWYQCMEVECSGRIDELQRLIAVGQGRWVSALGEDPRSVRVAFHISALCSPWVSYARVVAEYLRGKASHDLRNFYNSFLGLPSEEKMGGNEISVLERRREAPAFVVPEWATVVTAGADTQARGGKPYWYYVVRAWGPDLRSRLICQGKAMNQEELYRQTIDATWPVEGGGYTMRCLVVCVDSGGAVELEGEDDASTTDLVYGMARSDPARVIPIKGHGGTKRPDRLIRTANVDYQPPGAPPTQVLLHTLDTEGLKDIISRLIRAEDPVLWEESQAADDQYLSHMTREEKTRVRIGRRFQLRWVNNTRKRDDLWDASVYCLAAAKMVRAEDRRDSASQKQAKRLVQRDIQQAQEDTRARGGKSWIGQRRRGGWIRRR